MNDLTPLDCKSPRLSTQTLFLLVAAIAAGMAPMAYFGWKGIVSAICITIAGILFVLGHRKIGAAIVVLLLLGQFFYPAVDGAREAILRSECHNSLRVLTLAMHEYESKHGHFPPPFSTDGNGTVLHSWRVILLPYLGEQELYDQIDKSKPWDDAVNQPFHNQMPDVFCCAAVKYHSRWGAGGSSTAYVVVIGENTAWSPGATRTFSALKDGSSQTVAIVESEKHRIPWMSTDDPTLSSLLEQLDFTKPHDGCANVSFFDGTVHMISDDVGIDRITEMLSIDDGK